MSEFVHPLRRPVQFGQQAITELRLREPEMEELCILLNHGEKAGDAMKEVLARCSGQPLLVIQKLSIPDSLVLAEWLGKNMGGGLPTGATPLAP